MEGLTDKAYEFLMVYGLKIVAAIAIFIIGRMVIGLLIRVVRRLLKRSNADETLVKFLISLTRIALLVFLFIMVLGALGVQTASFIAIIGAAG
ncbi:MAG: hypothetical protein MIO92_02975, partial [Methanosarcinaceae archaeon]|nr:hypothetical protein [Methanosarcinaceae archaeon]